MHRLEESNRLALELMQEEEDEKARAEAKARAKAAKKASAKAAKRASAGTMELPLPSASGAKSPSSELLPSADTMSSSDEDSGDVLAVQEVDVKPVEKATAKKMAANTVQRSPPLTPAPSINSSRTPRSPEASSVVSPMSSQRSRGGTQTLHDGPKLAARQLLFSEDQLRPQHKQEMQRRPDTATPPTMPPSATLGESHAAPQARASVPHVSQTKTVDAEGYLFFCSDKTEGECFQRSLFGSGARELGAMSRIGKATPLFLFNFSTRVLYGPFWASSAARMNLEPSAWARPGGGRSQFPAQISVCRVGRLRAWKLSSQAEKFVQGALSIEKTNECFARLASSRATTAPPTTDRLAERTEAVAADVHLQTAPPAAPPGWK